MYGAKAFDYLELREAEIMDQKLIIDAQGIVIDQGEKRIEFYKENQQSLMEYVDQMNNENSQLKGRRFWHDVWSWTKGAILGAVILLTVQSI